MSATTFEFPPPASLAEQGKIHALQGDHAVALVYYRIAMQQSQGSDAESRLLSRYFAECALESFEQMHDYQSVIDYCDRSLNHYESNPPESMIAAKDLAHILQRKAVALVKFDQKAAATPLLNDAITLAKKHGFTLPVAETLHNWLRSALHFDTRRLEGLLQQKSYYAITEKTVDPTRAAPLPPKILSSFQPGQPARA